ncbi:MAG: hypothetical protein M3135_04640 [Actinomycetota bacterium]|nr:hypothetical protein [Actinomycetota bacterium]
MDAYVITLRIVHIISAILWAGSALFFVAFVGPTVETLGPQAGRFFGHLVHRRKAVIFFLVVATLTAVAGGLLYWRDSRGLDIDWIQTGFGTGLTIGAVAGLISWFLVVLVLAPTAYRLTALGGHIEAAGRPPSDEEVVALAGLQSRLNSFSMVNVVFLGVAAVAMATARYLSF